MGFPGRLATARVLVVDSDSVLAEAIAKSLRRQGYEVRCAVTHDQASRLMETSYVDVLVFEDLKPAADTLLAKARAMTESPLCFLMTSSGDVRSAVEAMRRGAVDYLEKPVDIDALTLRIERALETATMRRRLAVLDEGARSNANPVAVSAGMLAALALADRVAASPSSSALILGESGTGKEVIATRIHERSKRRSGPFVRVNMAAIADSMVEAELFGSVRGAFTDAKRDRAGYLASASGGTVLLDELCEFRVELQAKLLRALETRRFFPVGSDREQSFDARVIAATNRDPEEAIASGLLREDLFFRIAPVVIRLPPLRERREDILPLAARFVACISADLGSSPRTLSDAAKEALLAHDWPGNVRELRNAVERAILLSDSDLLTPDLFALERPRLSKAREGAVRPPSQSGTQRRFDPDTVGGDLAERQSADAGAAPLMEATQAALQELEREYIARVLRREGGSKVRAAAALGISRTTLWEKLKRYGL